LVRSADCASARLRLRCRRELEDVVFDWFGFFSPERHFNAFRQ